MNKKSKVVLLAMAALGAASAQVAARAADVTLYSERDYKGDKKPISGDWSGGGSWGDKTRSIRVPDGYVVTIYRDRDYKGDKKVIKDNWNPSSKDSWFGRVRSVRVRGEGNDNNGGNWGGSGSSKGVPAVFAGPKWNGPSRSFSSDWRGDKDWDGEPYSVQSVKVPNGWQVRVYSGSDFGGQSMLLTKDWSSLAVGDWGKPIKSVKIVERGSGNAVTLPDDGYHRPTTKPAKPVTKPATKPSKPVAKPADLTPVEPRPL